MDRTYDIVLPTLISQFVCELFATPQLGHSQPVISEGRGCQHTGNSIWGEGGSDVFNLEGGE